jgi:hypothetical protein
MTLQLLRAPEGRINVLFGRVPHQGQCHQLEHTSSYRDTSIFGVATWTKPVNSGETTILA